MISILSSLLCGFAVINAVTSLPISSSPVDGINISKRETKAVISLDFPDPTFIQIDSDTWYAFATSSNNKQIQIAKSLSGDLEGASWTYIDKDALPDAGAWAQNNRNIWAPYITKPPGSSQFVLYYAAQPAQNNPSGMHCIGVATSNSIEGPYQPSPTPWVCPLDQGGAIDPAVFLDPESKNLFVLYKIDGNALNVGNSNLMHPTPIMMQQVSNDGITPIGQAVPILDRNESDGPLIEAPAMFYDAARKTYFLFYSSNYFNTPAYNVKLASASSVTGPYTPLSDSSPFLKTGDAGINAPGSVDVSTDGKYMVLHGTASTPDAPLVRFMYAAQLDLSASTETNGAVAFVASA